MTAVLAVAAAVAVLNPPRTRLGLPEGARRTVDATRLAAGVARAGAILLGLGAVSGSLLEWLEISPETFRIAAGFVLVIAAAWMLFVPVPTEEPAAAGAAGLVWPIAYPRLVSPEAITLALTVGASDGVGTLGIGLIPGLAAVGVLGVVPLGPMARRVLAVTGRVVAIVVVLVAIWLAIQGVREV